MQAEVFRKSIIQKERELKEKSKCASEQAINISIPQNHESHHSQNLAIRPGVIILGMHRSGTSLVGGLVNKMGLKTGGPLIQAASDNEKGFFERIDVVLQDDYLMQKQGVHYSFRTFKYDPVTGLKHILMNEDEKFFKEGKRGLAFLNNPSSYPWMLKDPRLCITLRTWLPLLKFVPAILFAYRHPFDVAMSLHKREFEKFEFAKGLKLWYVYNRRAVQQSNDLCRVVTSHRLVMQQPKEQFDRIYDELHECGVDVPHKLTTEEIQSFIDIKLQHGRSTLKDKSCEADLSSLVPPSGWPTSEPKHITLYRECMRVYCAMEDGSAFTKAFSWDETVKDD